VTPKRLSLTYECPRIRNTLIRPYPPWPLCIFLLQHNLVELVQTFLLLADAPLSYTKTFFKGLFEWSSSKDKVASTRFEQLFQRQEFTIFEHAVFIAVACAGSRRRLTRTCNLSSLR